MHSEKRDAFETGVRGCCLRWATLLEGVRSFHIEKTEALRARKKNKESLTEL